MKTLYLTIRDRLAVPSLLPNAFSVAEWRMKNAIIEKVKFTEDEVKEFKITTDGNSINWDPNVENSRMPIAFEENEIEFITACAQDGDTKRTLTDMTIQFVADLLDKSDKIFSAPLRAKVAIEDRTEAKAETSEPKKNKK